MSSLEFHPLANIFPFLDGQEFDDLVSNIKANGQKSHPDGRILAGHSRYRACAAAGVEPKFEAWDGQGSAVDFAVTMNLRCRQMSAAERWKAAAERLPFYEPEAAERRKRKSVPTTSSMDDWRLHERIQGDARTLPTYVSANWMETPTFVFTCFSSWGVFAHGPCAAWLAWGNFPEKEYL